jgi:hypothetical protein
VFWNIMAKSTVKTTDLSKEQVASIFDVEEDGISLQNFSPFSTGYTALYPAT